MNTPAPCSTRHHARMVRHLDLELELELALELEPVQARLLRLAALGLTLPQRLQRLCFNSTWIAIPSSSRCSPTGQMAHARPYVASYHGCCCIPFVSTHVVPACVWYTQLLCCGLSELNVKFRPDASEVRVVFASRFFNQDIVSWESLLEPWEVVVNAAHSQVQDSITDTVDGGNPKPPQLAIAVVAPDPLEVRLHLAARYCHACSHAIHG